MLVGLGIILVLVIADGVRRENQEFETTLSTFSGGVWVQEAEATNPAPAVIGEKLVDGNVGSIFVAFHQDSFDQISAALVEKYGPPRSRTVEDVVSKIGVHYKNYKARWVGRRLSLLCESVGTQVDQGSIHIFTSEYQNQMRSKDEDRTEQLKKRF